MREKAVVLCSGGVDSACAALLARKKGYDIYGIHFLRPRKEFEAAYATKFAKHESFPLKIIECDLTSLIREAQHEPLKYVTVDGDVWEFLLGRNFMYLTLAANYAVSIQAETIVVGFAPHDADPTKPPKMGDYPDCHYRVLNQFASLLTSCVHFKLKPSVPSLKIWAPLFEYVVKKSDVFELALTLGVDLSDTITCYTPIREDRSDGVTEWVPCGKCLACLHRARALEELQEGQK